MSGRSLLRHAGHLALRVAFTLSLVATEAAAGSGTRFEDLRGTHDSNNITTTLVFQVDFRPGTSWCELTLPRAESFGPGGEIAVFNQQATTSYSSVPPYTEEDRSEWFTRLTWPPGTIGSHTRILVTVQCQSTADVSVDGLNHDLTRRPGDYYTHETSTIDFDPGIREVIEWIDATSSTTPGLPPGEHGFVQRWMAYVEQNIEVSRSIPSFVYSHAASWAWHGGYTDPFGQVNVLASGLRTLGFPVAVGTSFRLPSSNEPAPSMQDSYDGLVGISPWAGVWSDGLNRFVPLDLRARQYGYLSAQHQVMTYVEEMNHIRLLVDAADPLATVEVVDADHAQSSTGTTYGRVRTRLLDDGGSASFTCHDVTGTHAPGPVSGVPTSSGAAERLQASHPFRHALSLSLRLESGSRATITVHDVAGRLVTTVCEGRSVQAGENFFRWLPAEAPAGVYFVRAELVDGRQFVARAVRSP